MKTAAVIITYNPDTAIADRVKSIARECQMVFVVDNGSNPECMKSLKKIEASLVLLGENTGIAHAQNVGLKLAFDKKADAVILFDHDSTPQAGFTAALWAAYHSEKSPVIVGAQIFDVNTRHFSKYPVYSRFLFRRQRCETSGRLQDAMLAIASGTLVSRAVFERVGGMREEFFIDYVDWEFCLRARRHFGVRTIICGDAVLHHARGERRGKKFLGVTVRPPGYSRFRYRHIYRNRATLFREYFFTAPAFTAFEVIAVVRDTMLLLFESERWHKLGSALASWFQGFFSIRRKS